MICFQLRVTGAQGVLKRAGEGQTGIFLMVKGLDPNFTLRIPTFTQGEPLVVLKLLV